MIPQTGATLLAFVFLVVPGIIFELLRRTRRPSVDRSPFEEFAVAVISSAAFTFAALAVLAIIRAWIWPGAMPDLRAWFHHPKAYPRDHYRLIARTLVIQIALACVFAITVHGVITRAESNENHPLRKIGARVGRALGHDKGPRSFTSSVWRRALAGSCPPDHAPKASVALRDVRIMSGFVAFYTNTGDDDDRDMALQHPMTVQWPNAEPITLPAAELDVMIIPAREIVWLTVSYLPTPAQ